MKKALALLTGGGDAPGLNGIILSVARTCHTHSVPLYGVHDGFEGVFDERMDLLDARTLDPIIQKAGTVLGSSNRSGVTGREEEFALKLKKRGIETLIAAGGDGTFRALRGLSKYGVKLVGVPKTIDNDLYGTDFCFGFDTACTVVSKAVDTLRTTAESHRRILVIEAMGRTAGWLALGGGIAGVADAILLPETPYSPERLLDFARAKQKQNSRSLIVVVSEGARPEGGDVVVKRTVSGSPEPIRLGGIAEKVAALLEDSLQWEARSVVLGHLQRGAEPTTTDRFLSLSMGTVAAEAAIRGQSDVLAAYRDGEVKLVSLDEVKPEPKLVSPTHRWVSLAKSSGIFVDGVTSSL